MKSKNIKFFLFFLIVIQGCSSQTTNVKLYKIYSSKDDIKVYKNKTGIPFTGKYISKSHVDQVEIDFKEGKMNGNFVRTFLNGDTLEYSKYNNGIELFTIDYIYDNGELDYKDLVKNEIADKQDRELFIKTCDLIKNRNFNDLYNFLDPLSRSYEKTFQKLEQLFGSLEDYKIKEINKKYYSYNDSEHISGVIDFQFSEKDIEATFLIVETPFELSGEAFVFPDLSYELEKNNLVSELIKIINQKNVEEFISLTNYTQENKELIDKQLNEIGKMSSEYEFLNSHFKIYNELYFIQDYLIEINGDKQVLSLIFEINENEKMNLLNINFTPYFSDFYVLHRVM